VVGRIHKQRHRTARLAWARACRRWSFNTWQHILFSDNPVFDLVLAMDVIVCTEGVGNFLRTSVCVCVCESDRFGAGSVMVRAGICHDGHTRLKIVQGTLNAVKYRCNILDPIVLSFLLQRNFYHVFKHDNARCHVACVCQDFLNQNQIRVPPWPTLSPDLSPIKHLCGALGGRRARQSKSTGNTTGAE
jgi:hypothetical protein